MGLLYKDRENIKVSVFITQMNGKVDIEFTSDCGKFGTDENLAGYRLSPERLLNILSDVEVYTEDEII